MSSGEHKITDTKGKFAQAVKDGRAVNDVSWNQGRILLSNKRIILIGNSGKRTVPLSKIQGMSGRHDPNQKIAQVSSYVSLKLGDDVLLISAADHETFETDIYRAMLDQKVIQAKHPAVAGGVVQDSKWEKARLKVEDDAIAAALESGTFVRLDLDDISGVGTEDRTVDEEKRTVIEVKHTEGQTNVQTHLTGKKRTLMFLKAFLREGERRSQANVDISESEKEVLMALYSGVSPFEIPAFLDMEVDRVEEIFERLVDVDVLEEVRIRREVALNSRGRNIASEAMNQQ
ncbi:MAG: CheF family chemotaxis protein [Halobacteriota archaeon]